MNVYTEFMKHCSDLILEHPGARETLIAKVTKYELNLVLFLQMYLLSIVLMYVGRVSVIRGHPYMTSAKF